MVHRRRDGSGLSDNHSVGITKLKTTVLITATLLVLASIIVNQRTNLLIYSMTSGELPELLEPKDEGEEVTWFDDYYTIQKIDERTFAIGEPRYYQLNFNYLILGDSRAIIFDAVLDRETFVEL